MKVCCTLLFLFFLFFGADAQSLVQADCDVHLGPDVSVCNNATFALNPNGNPNATYSWTGPAGLSCYNCPSPTVSGLTTGTYTYIVTSQTPQCTDKDTIKITVAPGQQPQYNIANDQTICAGAQVFLGGASFPSTFYQWTSNPPGLNVSVPNPAVKPTATTRYFVAVANASCPFFSVDSVLITVVQPPVLDIQPDIAICNGESVLLGQTEPQPGTTYSWTPNDGTLNNPNIANPLATPLQTNIYQLTATNAACVVMRTVTVSVATLNLSLNVGDTVANCKGTPLVIQATLTPPGAASVTWMPLTGLQVSPSGLNAVATPSESITYTVMAAVPGCKRSFNVYVKVDSLPQDLSISPMDTTICYGSKVQLVSLTYEPAEFPNLEFLWTPAEGQLTPDSLFNMVVQPTDTTVYQRVTTSGACVDTSTAIVKVIKPATMSAMPVDTLICPGASVQLQAVYSPGVTNIEWSPPTSLSCIQCDKPLATPANTTTYTVMGEFQGCPVNASTTVSVKALPIIQFPNDTQLCGGESVTLNTAFDPTATYNWTSNDPNFVPTTNPQPVVTPTQSATYFVQADNGCKNQGSVTILVTNAILTVGGATTICQNQSANLTASGSLPGTFVWNTGQTGQNIPVSPTTTTTYTVVYTFGNNCQLTGQVTVTVQGIAPEINPPSDNELCPGENVTLNSNVTPGAMYAWISNPSGFTSSQAAPVVMPAQTTQYTVTATLGNCTTVETVEVIVYNATLTLPDDITVCKGESADLTASGSLTGKYEWSTGDTSATLRLTPNQAGAFIYDLVYTYGDGCTLEDAVKVTVKDNFTLKVVADPDTNRINVGDTIALMAVVSPSQNLSNFQFEWVENGTTNVGSTEEIQVITSSNEPTITYTLTATSPNGCVQDTTLEFVLVQPSVVVPNAFTPNNDGVNDVFRLKVLEGSVTILGMDIYNRWGTKVFSSTESDAVWDGKMQNGKEAPSDVYAYFIRWQRGDGALQPPKQGDIALLR